MPILVLLPNLGMGGSAPQPPTITVDADVQIITGLVGTVFVDTDHALEAYVTTDMAFDVYVESDNA